MNFLPDDSLFLEFAQICQLLFLFRYNNYLSWLMTMSDGLVLGVFYYFHFILFTIVFILLKICWCASPIFVLFYNCWCFLYFTHLVKKILLISKLSRLWFRFWFDQVSLIISFECWYLETFGIWSFEQVNKYYLQSCHTHFILSSGHVDCSLFMNHYLISGILLGFFFSGWHFEGLYTCLS